MKTAMQKLIEELRSLAFTECHIGTGDIVLSQGHIDELEEKYLKKEKEQIIDAYYGKINGVFGYREEGQEYYNQTYNQNK